MNRSPALEEAFKKRYNRSVEVCVRQERDKKISRSVVIIKSKKVYTLTDTMKEGKTIEASLEVDGKKFRYPRYVDAEIHCADLLGEE